MEETLRQLQKEAAGGRHRALRDACGSALETLKAARGTDRIPACRLRQQCVCALQMALETKSTRLVQTALTGMQKLVSESRFLTEEAELEAEPEAEQPLSQMLEALRVTPELQEDLQVEVMKVLLCLTYCSTFHLNARNVLRIAQVCIQTYVSSGHQRSINTAVRATLSQVLGDLTLQLHTPSVDGDESLTSSHQPSKDASPAHEAVCEDVIRVLAEFCDRLESESDGDQLLQLLYLECVLSVLSNCPPTMHLHRRFTDIVWKQLCPTLVVILGNPASDKGVTSAQAAAPQEGEAACVLPDQGRGSGCSSGAPALMGPVARTLCYVAAELVRLVGSVESLKPVLQSLYHRLLLYPPPQHRLEALRIMKEMLASPQRLFDLAGPYVSEPDTRKKSFSRRRSHLDLLKLIMDGISETCLKGGMEACYCAVSCAHGLLGALDELSRGRGLLPAQSRLLTGRLEELAEGAESMREAVEVNEDDFRWQRDVLSSENPRQSPDISISVTAVEGHGSPDNAPQSTAPPDVVQRSHGPAFPDITNFLTVETRTRSHGSRYSESNFSAEEQELSRTEFDSCDQYSMAAEKDSGRSDVSDMGSDQCSLADEEQTPQDCLRGAALSLKLLRNQEADQRSARMFVDALAALLPRLLRPDAAADVDVSLQNFSSTFCSGLHAGGVDSPGLEASENLSCQALMNADGLYLVSYYALLLNLKLCCSDFYHRKPASPPVSLKEFVRQIQSSGVLVVLSQAWIEELYSQVMERNLLGEAGYWGSEEDQSLPLITLLTDIEGLGSSGIGGQLMRKSSEQSPFSCGRSSSDVVVLAGVVFARYILTGCWKNLIDVLSVPLTGRMAGSSRALAFILGAEGVKEQSQRERDAICLSLDGLRKAAALSCVLGVAANCASALAQMAAASCVQEEKEAEAGDALTQVKQKLEQMSRAPSLRLHTAHVLCMDAILNAGLEMGSHNPDCWTHVFRVVEYVSSLEHSHFSDGVRQPPVTLAQAQAEPGGDLIQPRSIQQLLKENPHGKELLTGGAAARAVCALSTQADRLFEDAVAKLNLVALVDFLHQLRKASQSQLFDSVTETGDYSLAMPGEARSTQEKRSALHLFRLGDAMLLIVKNQPERPLLHVMRAWSVVAPHLVEASCHKERHVSQKAVSFIHDVLLEVLSRWAEPPHFHFSEALFRPFEHIMQLELCDEDVQDQVVASVGELVETCSLQIRSGWRPLFSALRTVHGAEAKDYLTGAYRVGKSQAPVFDVFQAFISTDNIQVFANAATDYIMCLMKFVKGLGELDYKEIGDCVHVSGYSSIDLCLPALDYLRKCSQLLARIYKMPSKPVFLSARLASLPVRVHERSVGSEDGLDDVLAEFDDDTGLIQVWILLLEQLTAAVSNCPRQHQPLTLELLFELLRDITTTPGPGFALFSVVQLLLPIMSLWLQRSHGDHCYWDVAAANFKHAIGLSCELVVEHIRSFIHSDMGYESLMNVMLKDLLKLLVACVAEPAESISRVGCSCIRYVLVSAGPVFTEEMWRLACRALQDAFSATLQPAKKLLARFRSGSGGDSSSTGDACEVKVAAASRSPSADAEYTRIRAMAQQVFMLDTQCSPKTPGGKDGFEHAQSCVLILDVPTDLAHSR